MGMVGWCFNAADTYWQIWVCFEIHFAVFQDFDQGLNSKISHMKGIQMTTPDGLGALAST